MTDRPLVHFTELAACEPSPVSRRRRLTAACSILAVALLAGCDRFGGRGGSSGEGLEVFFWIFIGIAVVGLLLLIFELVVLVLNFVKPKGWTMVLGFVFGGLNLLFTLGSVAGALNATGADPAEGSAPADQILATILTAGVGGLFALLLFWSAIRAKRVLAAN